MWSTHYSCTYYYVVSFFMLRRPRRSTPFPYTTLFRSGGCGWPPRGRCREGPGCGRSRCRIRPGRYPAAPVCRPRSPRPGRSEEHTSELQSRGHLVCRLLLEKKKVVADEVPLAELPKTL